MSDWEVKKESLRQRNLRAARTYFYGSHLLRDLESSSLMDNFILTEGAFQELISAMVANQQIAKNLNDQAVLLLMKTDSKKEIEDLLVMAESLANG